MLSILYNNDPAQQSFPATQVLQGPNKAGKNGRKTLVDSVDTVDIEKHLQRFFSFHCGPPM